MKARDMRFIRTYLLGSLPEDESEEYEREYFASEQALDELEAAENELIDAHLGGRLTPEEQERFERHFLATPDRARRVELSRTLRAIALPAPAAPEPAELASALAETARPPRRSLAVWSGWAAAALLAVVAGRTGLRVSALQDEVNRVRYDSADERHELSERDAAQQKLLQKLQKDLAQAAGFTPLVLRSGQPRSATAGSQAMTLDRDVPGLRLDLLVPD